jgi:hypothetical protein
MKVELKSFKHLAQMSEETECFYAQLYIDGKKVGTCENRGHGGMTNIHISDSTVRNEFETYAKSLGLRTVQLGSEPFTYEMDGERLIDDLVLELLKKKEEARFQKIAKNAKKKNLAQGYPITIQMKFKNQKGEQIVWYPCKNTGEIEAAVAEVKKKYKLAQVEQVSVVE